MSTLLSNIYMNEEPDIKDPTTRREAMASSEWKEWLKVEDAENEALSQKGELDMVDIEKGNDYTQVPICV